MPGRRFSRKAWMSPSSSGIKGGQPSTTQPIAGPWLSPKVVTRKRWPKVLWDMGSKAKRGGAALSTVNDPRDGKGGGGGKRTDDCRLQGAAERRDAGQLALDAAKIRR